MPKARILGINDEMDICAICGKRDLKRVVWLELASGEITHAGVDCAAKILYNYPRDKKVAKKETDILLWQAKVVSYARGYYHNWYLGKLKLPSGQEKATPLEKQVFDRFGVSTSLRGSVLKTPWGEFDLSKEPHETAHHIPTLEWKEKQTAEDLIESVCAGVYE